MDKKPATETRRWTKQSLLVLAVVALSLYAIFVTAFTLLIVNELQNAKVELNNTQLQNEILLLRMKDK